MTVAILFIAITIAVIVILTEIRSVGGFLIEGVRMVASLPGLILGVAIRAARFTSMEVVRTVGAVFKATIVKVVERIKATVVFFEAKSSRTANSRNVTAVILADSPARGVEGVGEGFCYWARFKTETTFIARASGASFRAAKFVPALSAVEVVGSIYNATVLVGKGLSLVAMT